MVEDGKEAHRVNLCQQCYNEKLTAQGLAPLKSWQWKAVVEKKAHRGRLWRMLRKQGMWEYFSFERVNANKFMKDAEKEKQWQRGSPAKEYLKQVKSSADTHCTPK